MENNKIETINRLQDIFINDSNINNIKFYRNGLIVVLFIINVSGLIYTLLIAPVYLHVIIDPKRVYNVSMILVVGNSFLFILLMIVIKNSLPVYVTILLNRERFEIYIQKSLYLKLFWNQIESIEIIKLKGSGEVEYNIKFFGRKNKIVRLNLIMLNKKKLYEAIESVKIFSGYLNINVKEKVEKFHYDDEYKKDKKIIDELKRKN